MGTHSSRWCDMNRESTLDKSGDGVQALRFSRLRECCDTTGDIGDAGVLLSGGGSGGVDDPEVTAVIEREVESGAAKPQPNPSHTCCC